MNSNLREDSKELRNTSSHSPENTLPETEPTKVPTLQIGNYKIKDFCSICPHKKKKCSQFSFTDIMYSKVPSILNLAQLSLGKLKAFKLTEEEYTRLVRYNISYASFMEELQSRYRKTLVVMELANFNFSPWAYAVIDEIFHISLKWFEKLIFWNRANSIKVKPCSFYRELLSENIDFVVSLMEDALREHNHGLLNIIDLEKIKENFKEDIGLSSLKRPETNGDYFTHTEKIKDTLVLYLEFLQFVILSYDRTLQEKSTFIYIAPSYFLLNESLIKDILTKLPKTGKKVKLKVVSKNPRLKSELLFLTKSILKELKVNLEVEII